MFQVLPLLLTVFYFSQVAYPSDEVSFTSLPMDVLILITSLIRDWKTHCLIGRVSKNLRYAANSAHYRSLFHCDQPDNFEQTVNWQRHDPSVNLGANLNRNRLRYRSLVILAPNLFLRIRPLLNPRQQKGRAYTGRVRITHTRIDRDKNPDICEQIPRWAAGFGQHGESAVADMVRGQVIAFRRIIPGMSVFLSGNDFLVQPINESNRCSIISFNPSSGRSKVTKSIDFKYYFPRLVTVQCIRVVHSEHPSIVSPVSPTLVLLYDCISSDTRLVYHVATFDIRNDKLLSDYEIMLHGSFCEGFPVEYHITVDGRYLFLVAVLDNQDWLLQTEVSSGDTRRISPVTGHKFSISPDYQHVIVFTLLNPGSIVDMELIDVETGEVAFMPNSLYFLGCRSVCWLTDEIFALVSDVHESYAVFSISQLINPIAQGRCFAVSRPRRLEEGSIHPACLVLDRLAKVGGLAPFETVISLNEPSHSAMRVIVSPEYSADILGKSMDGSDLISVEWEHFDEPFPVKCSDCLKQTFFDFLSSMF